MTAHKPIKLVWDSDTRTSVNEDELIMLGLLAVAESNLVRAGKQSALPHFIAIVKELERASRFHFEEWEEDA